MPARPVRIALVLALASCGGGGGDGGPNPTPTTTTPATTPPTTPTNLEDSGEWEPSDTAILVTDLVPAATLRIVETGVWTFDPAGGPWTSLTGDLTVDEYPDGVIPSDTAVVETADTGGPPPCELVFAVSGEVVPAPACPGCDVVADVTFTLVSGEPTACHDPDLPSDGAIWRLGWASADGVVRFDYFGSGVWVDWFAGESQGDTLRVTYDTTKAVAVGEEE